MEHRLSFAGTVTALRAGGVKRQNRSAMVKADSLLVGHHFDTFNAREFVSVAGNDRQIVGESDGSDPKIVFPDNESSRSQVSSNGAIGHGDCLVDSHDGNPHCDDADLVAVLA